MVGSGRLLELIGLAYDAAADPTRWSACLAALGEALRCPAVGIFPLETGQASSYATLCVGHDPALLARYDTYYGRPDVNPYAQRVEPSMLVPGTVLRAEAVCPDRELRRTEYFEDWLRPQGLGAGGFAIVGSVRQPVVLSFARAPARGHLDAQEIALVRALVPHLGRALTLGEHLERLDAEHEARSAALDIVGVGIILVDACARPLLVNRRAQALLDACDGIGVDRDGLVAARRETTDALHRLVAETTGTTNGRGTSAGGALTLPRPSGRRALMALVTPLARGRWPVRGVAAAGVLVNDPEEVVMPAAEALRRLWGLTPAEAGLACHLASGRSLEQAAQALGVRVPTVRTQLARIFAKTGTRRQAELIRLLVGGVGPPLVA
jgi:DNA-binding CsgD family transcriptional regulator